MGMVMELVTGHGTAIGAALAALTPAAGNTFTIRHAREGSRIHLVQAWADVQVAGAFRIRSPQLHDAENGLRFDTVISELSPLLPKKGMQPLISQDELTVELAGSAVAGDVETCCFLVYYEDLLGAEGRFIDHDELANRLEAVYAINNTLTLLAAAGYNGEEAITAEFDQFKANRDYALMGYLVDAECACVRWRGADTSNYGVGGPGDDLGRHYTRSWFVDLSRYSGMKMIPVFNAANKDGILVDGAQDENATAVTVTTLLGLLAPGAGP